jgi:hypothetical protein
MTEYLAKAIHSYRIERYENQRCPKNYCKHHEPFRRGKSY